VSGLSEPELRGVEEAVEGAGAKLDAKTRLSAAVASRGSLYMLCSELSLLDQAYIQYRYR
jgi:hypothetical protein